MLRFLLSKIFKKNMDGVLYIAPVVNILLCFTIFNRYIYQDGSENLIFLILTCLFAMIGITVNLYRFIRTLQKPYQKSNLHIVLCCIFTTITFFAVIYTTIYSVLPNSFFGLHGVTSLDKCIDMVYFSIITFTTLGYGDIYPIASIGKIFVSIETMSFFIFFGILASNYRIFIKPKGIED